MGRGAHLYPAGNGEQAEHTLSLHGIDPWYEIEALVRAGEIERAVGDVERFEAHFGKSRRHRIPYLRSLTVLAQHRGQIDMAIDHLREAANVAEGIGLPGERWLIWKTLGDLYLKQTEQEQAHHTYGEAARLVSQLAATLRAEKRRKKYLSSPLVEQGLRASSF